LTDFEPSVRPQSTNDTDGWYSLLRVTFLGYEGLRFCSAVGAVGKKGGSYQS